ncbi:hypothetical protein [Rhodopila sp.]|uniref:hypothetical protein n=1 Tax=Rhodopila sp. TaxID=2480087 RepID=UPI003D1503CA
MRNITLGTLAILGLLLATASIASAAPATGLIGRTTLSQATSIQPVYYYWNHHRYRHRSWDRRHRRWRYY